MSGTKTIVSALWREKRKKRSYFEADIEMILIRVGADLCAFNRIVPQRSAAIAPLPEM